MTGTPRSNGVPRPPEPRPDEVQRRRRRVRMPDAPAGALPAGPAPAPSTPPAIAAVGALLWADAAPAEADLGPGVSVQTSPVHDETLPDGETVAAERGLRGIVGGGSSQVTPGAALRARDAARPSPADLARAEADLTIVRRNWTPRD